MHVAFTVLSEGLASVGTGSVGHVDGLLPMTTSANGVETVGTTWSEAGWDSVAFAELEVERLSRSGGQKGALVEWPACLSSFARVEFDPDTFRLLYETAHVFSAESFLVFF